MFRFLELVFDGFLKLEKWNQDGVKFPLLVVRTSDSVSGLLWDRTQDQVLLVRQNRVAMKTDENPTGSLVELVAGRFDVNLGPKALFVKEAKEEAGANITEEDVDILNTGASLALSPGVLTERAYLAFVEIRAEHLDDGESYGVAADGESTNRVWMPVAEFLAATHQDLRVFTLARELENRLLKERLAALEAAK